MLINEVTYDPEKSELIDNCIPIYIRKQQQKPQFYEAWYMKKKWDKFPGLSTKEIFKQVFGRQQTCVNYTCRCWIWSFSNDDCSAIIYCLVDIRGCHWEMDRDGYWWNTVKLQKKIEDKIIE